MSEKIVYALQNLSRSFDHKVVLKEITLAFLAGAKIGVIGRNGAGKSTLLRIMAGEDREHEGLARPAEGITVGYLPQEPRLDPSLTVRQNVEQALAPIRALLRRYEALNEELAGDLDPEAMEKTLARLDRAQAEIDHRDAWEIDRQVETAMTKLHLPPGEADVTELSGGERRRVALCRILLAHPDLLLLDEPTNHLDVETVSWLEQTLAAYQGTVIVITHDRFFLDRVVGWMLEIHRGAAIPYKGNYSAYLEAKAARLAQEEKQERSLARFLERELQWIRMNPKARTARNKSRVKNYERLLGRQVTEREGSVELYIPPGKRLGDRVLELEEVGFSYGERPILDRVSFRLRPGEIFGVVGPNGTGKTTLLKLITGELQPREGKVHLGSTVELCHLDQERDSLDEGRTVWEEISGGQDEIVLGPLRVNSRAYVSRFNFGGADQQQAVGTLSGGQRNRVLLAKMLRRGGNLILLDEPTNDLDLDTLRVLEEAIQAFPGCMVVVSHDRYFLDRICSRILDLGARRESRFLDHTSEVKTALE